MAAGEPRAREAVPVPREAVMAERRLHAALAEVGFDVKRDFAVFRADATGTGQGFVAVCRLSVTTAERPAEVLETAGVNGDSPALAARPLDGGRAGAADAWRGEGEVPC
jgi:hypothetical protein